ncbi:MAG: hypothetical protein HYS21_05655 [Deltaproteobacteria bacterium]|nr:hypothetical protein [Deltaproteobacteria bacterium]
MKADTKKSAKIVSRITTDHEEVKKWVESRGGHPASVKKTRDKDEPGIIRIDFPGYRGTQSLEPISWDVFFEQFENRKLALLYQEKTASGRVSRFNKIISREAAEEISKAKKAA